MQRLKRLISRGLERFGYKIARTDQYVRFDNFVSLTRAVEHLLNERENLISENTARAGLLARLLGTPPSEAYFIIQSIGKCKVIPGDICEFGVAQGETSALIANEIRSLHDKRFHLFDSFAGLPRPSEKDQLKNDIFHLSSIENYAGAMAYGPELASGRLAAVGFPRDRAIFHEGFIEDTLSRDTHLPSAVCFAYIDFDFYDPTRMALDFLHTVTSPGAILIVDDYDFFSTGAKTAVDEFVAAYADQYSCAIPPKAYGDFAILQKHA